MRKLDETGSLLLPLIAVIVLLLGAIGFGVWAYAGQMDYKTNSDKKSAAAVAEAKKALSAEKEADFAKREKSPFKTYTGPAAYGSINIQYPKTWSAYVIEKSDNTTSVAGYMFPGVVPDISSQTTLFALRFQVIGTAYATALKTYDGPIKQGKVSAAAYQLPKVTGVTGMRLTGTVVPGTQQKTGTMVILPLRDKTLEIWTEGDSFQGDFSDIILANMTFVP
jgi:hypothetical protein